MSLFKEMSIKRKKNIKNSPVHAYVKIVSAAKEIEKKLSTR